MDSLKIAFCFFFIFCGFITGYGGAERYSATIEHFPFQGTLEVDRTPVCGGAIIGDQWIITARSCLPENSSETRRLRFRAGSSMLSKGGSFHTVSRMVPATHMTHQFFGGGDGNLGLVKVETPFTYASTIKWAAPDTDPLSENSEIQIAGWGIHESSSEKFLQTSTVKQISNAECAEMFKDLLNITTQMACLVPATKSDNACVGDVGSPVSADGLITAVVSNNEYCWTRGLPLVVTNIGHFGWFIAFTISEPILRYGPTPF